jgi:hypothetical protein
MSMSGYTKLFSSIVTSTVWREPDHVRLVWITMLALSDRFGVVEASMPGLADMARVSIKDCQDALVVLASPDRFSRTQDFEGRRIQPVDGGWQLINHGKYRDKLSVDERRVYNAKKQQESRQRKRASMTVNDESAESAHTEATPSPSSKATAVKIKTVVQRAHANVDPDGFTDFWSLYPNHKGRQAALKAWAKLSPDAALVSNLLAALSWQQNQPQWKKDRGQFVPMLSTWLNQRRWEDEPFEPVNQSDPNKAAWDRVKGMVPHGDR